MRLYLTCGLLLALSGFLAIWATVAYCHASAAGGWT
jgi:hypothetical protein